MTEPMKAEIAVPCYAIKRGYEIIVMSKDKSTLEALRHGDDEIIVEGWFTTQRPVPPAKPACDCKIQPCEIHDPTENLAIRLLEESGAVTLRDLVDTYRKVNKPSAGWPNNMTGENWIASPEYRRGWNKCHAAFTKSLSDRGSSPILCSHANEVPMQCICPPDCYCKSHSCKRKK